MSLRMRVAAALAPGGILAKRWPHYEQRQAQVELAADVARVLEHGGVLMAEAPTGVGKSLAYLLPAVLHAIDGDERVVVATCTRSLQDQLSERDLPALLEALGLPVPFAVLKGKSNYLCPRALDMAEGQGAEEDETIEALRAWAAVDPTGDLDRFVAPDAEAYRRVRPRVATDPSACTGAVCRRGRECFWARARRAASEARITIVNHALLVRAAEADGLLPSFEVLIIDEAHRLEGVLSSQLERHVSRHRFDELLRQTGSLAGPKRGGARASRGSGGLLARVRAYALPLLELDPARERLYGDLERLSNRADEARGDAERFFTSLAPGAAAKGGGPGGIYGSRQRYRSQAELLGKDLQPLQLLLEHAQVYCDALRRAAGVVQNANPGRDKGAAAGDELSAELELVSGRWERLRAELLELGEALDPDWVYWRALGPRSQAAELRGAPVSVGDHARRQLLSRARSVVLTSATLSAAGDFGWAAERLGMGEELGLPYETATYPSPFPLAQQMRTFVYAGGADEAASIAEVVAELAKATGRNTLVLFTAHQRLRSAREKLRALLPAGIPVMAQELDGPAGTLIDRFRLSRGAVLLGVQSLWEGVDFPGETLEVLVVAKLPFSVPDDPIVEARGERLRERGVDPFRGDAVPEAVLRFRQGIGRLIRRSDDRGVLVVCDPRLANASYRGPFRAALPVAPDIQRDARALAAEAARFFATEVGVTREDV